MTFKTKNDSDRTFYHNNFNHRTAKEDEGQIDPPPPKKGFSNLKIETSEKSK